MRHCTTPKSKPPSKPMEPPSSAAPALLSRKPCSTTQNAWAPSSRNWDSRQTESPLGEIMKIAVIGLGEVGRCYAKALHIAGLHLRLCDARPAPVSSALAAPCEPPMQTPGGDWLRECAWMLSCVTGAH